MMFVPKQDVFCTETGRFLYRNRTFFVPKQDVFCNATKYAILCNNNTNFRGNQVIMQDYDTFRNFATLRDFMEIAWYRDHRDKYSSLL